MKFTPRQKSIAIEAERYNSLVKKLEKDALILSNEQQVEIKAEILKLERKVKRDEQEFREELNVQKNIEFKKTRDVILKVIEKLAIDEKYDLIITEGAIYASKKVNISQQVLDLLEIENKKSALVKQK
jgi:outer membrane protein